MVALVALSTGALRHAAVTAQATAAPALDAAARANAAAALDGVVTDSAGRPLRHAVGGADSLGRTVYTDAPGAFQPAFSRSAFGMVKGRTDGERLLVYPYSGTDGLEEAYAFRADVGRVAAGLRTA